MCSINEKSQWLNVSYEEVNGVKENNMGKYLLKPEECVIMGNAYWSSSIFQYFIEVVRLQA